MAQTCGSGRRKQLATALVGLVAILGVAGRPLPATAQATPPGQAPAPAAPVTGILADPTFQAAQKRYEALPEAERRAIQEALMWTGDFAGAGSGTYGPLTFRAIQAFQKRAGVAPDGLLAPRERAALEAAATKARGELKFTRLQDGKAGLQIGVPQAVLPKATPGKTGTRYAAADGTIALETFSQTGTDLAALFAQLTADQVGRKVTYKVLRPDFFVIAADQDGKRSYTRFAPGAQGLKGFVFVYPVAAATAYDRVAVAIANSFDPGGAAPAVAATTPSAPPPQAPAPVAQAGAPLATGIVIAAGKVLTAGSLEACVDLAAAGHAARIARSDRASGLVILDVPGLRAPATAMGLAPRPATGAGLVVLGFAPGGSGAADPVLSASPGEARIPAGTEGLRVIAALQKGGAGSPVLDRSGALVGIVAAVPQEPRLVAGIVPAASYPVTGAEAFGAFAGLKPAAATRDASLGDLVVLARDWVVGITCRK